MAFVLVGTACFLLLIVLANFWGVWRNAIDRRFAKSNCIARQPGFMQKMEP